MSVPFLQPGDEIPERRIGPGPVGYAYLQVGGTRRVGLCVRHRPDNSPRLVFDLIVSYQRETHLEYPYFRLVRTEVVLEDLSKGVDILISKRSWANARLVVPPLYSEQWRSLPARDDGDTKSWKEQTVSCLSWRNQLRWPVLHNATKLPPPMSIPDCQMAILHSDEAVCIVDPAWLNSSRHNGWLPPKLFRDSEYTYFFPEVSQSDLTE